MERNALTLPEQEQEADKTPDTMCNCINIPMGSYANQTILQYPDWFVSERKVRAAGIDNCILEEIKTLWERGIQTSESCCGHNISPAYISVLPEYIPRMMELGYKHLICPATAGVCSAWDENGFRADTFEPKNLPRT